MSITAAIVVIICLAAIIPDLVVLVMAFLKILSLERRIESVESLRNEFRTIDERLQLARSGAEEAKVRCDGLTESLAQLNAKWNARLRVQDMRERKAAAREEAEEEQSPKFEQQEMFPLPTQQDDRGNHPRKRSFGDFPH